MCKWIVLALFSLSVVACGGGGTDDGGIIGTGIRLDGTASSSRAYASNDIEIKARSGERSTAAIASNGRFSSTAVEGTGPYLMRADLGNNEYLYSIAYDDGTGDANRNLHSYTDAAARNWFATNGLDIDAEFEGGQAIDALPTQAQIDAILNSLFAIVAAVLGEYNLSGTDLASTSYDANGAGVDLYLTSNPVLVNQGNITIIVTDQTTQTLTEASANVPLGTDFTANDTQAPSAPTALRALASALNEIVVVWEAATDNIGVTAYQVFRDGDLIATTPFPVYTDTNLSSNVDYSYTVVAIDASGNPSNASATATSQTLADVDTQAPPEPQSLMLTPNSNNMQISWSQSAISDVAAFNVSRSVGTGVSSTLANVTATFMTDTNIMSGTEYCYQVTAIDASGNESDPTPVTCATTAGTTVTTPIDTGTPPDTTDLTAPLVDVSNMVCTETIDNDIDVNTTLSAGCYLANSGITVSEPANLTLQPGVVIKFGSTEEIFVSSGASLTAQGTASNPIVLTGQETTSGFWKGVRFFYSNSNRNILDHVQIEYAGGGVDANIETVATSSNPTRVAISNTSLINGSEYGFDFQNGTLLDKFERNRVTGNAQPGVLSPYMVGTLGSDSTYSGNTTDAIRVRNNDLESDTTFERLDVPYRLGDLRLEAKLTINPGVTMEFTSGSQLFVTDAGTLVASGNATNPILMTSTEATPGFWDGVRLFYTNTGNILEHVTIEYGGAAATDSGNLVISAYTSSPSRLIANNVTLRNSQSNGFVIDSGASLQQFDNITSTGNGRPGIVDTLSAHLIGPGGNFIGNAEDVIRVKSGDIEADVTWRGLNVPYSIAGLRIEDILEIAAGATLIMDAGSEIFVTSSGALRTVGTAAQPVVLTAKEPIPGYWDGIRLFYSPTVNNSLTHTVVEYGGGGTADPATTGNIRMSCFDTSPSRLTLTNTSLDFSLGWGLYMDPNGCIATEGAGVTYSGNGLGDINQ